MPEFDLVFDKVREAMDSDENLRDLMEEHADTNQSELEEIEELRQFSAELQETDAPSFTTT